MRTKLLISFVGVKCAQKYSPFHHGIPCRWWRLVLNTWVSR